MTIEQQEVLVHLRQCFGATCGIDRFEQLKGGARKQVFLLALRNPSTTCVMYLWQNAANYFAERVAAGFEETQSDEKAPALFLINTNYLLAQGVNVPRVLYTGKVAAGQHFAFVEQIRGGDFDRFAASAAVSARQTVLTQVGAQLATLHAQQRSYPGGLQDAPSTQSKSPQDATLARAILEVTATAEARPQVAEYQAQISEKLQALHAQLTPRTVYHLLHGELAGSHVLVREGDHAVYFIDIEGIHFGDLESEHTFLQLIYGADYSYLARADLEAARMAFYKFAMHVSLVYAGSCFMLRGFHDQAWAERLFKGHFAHVLNSL